MPWVLQGSDCDAGFHPVAPSGSGSAGDYVCAACEPDTTCEDCSGAPVFEWDGSQWVLAEACDCVDPGETPTPPETPGTTIGEQACGTCDVTDCCVDRPDELVATLTSSCAELNGQTATLTKTMPGGQTWTGTLPFIGCFGTRTLTLSCNDGVWSLQVAPGACLTDDALEGTGECDPIDLDFGPFEYSYIAMSACECCAFAGGTFNVQVTG